MWQQISRFEIQVIILRFIDSESDEASSHFSASHRAGSRLLWLSVPSGIVSPFACKLPASFRLFLRCDTRTLKLPASFPDVILLYTERDTSCTSAQHYLGLFYPTFINATNNTIQPTIQLYLF